MGSKTTIQFIDKGFRDILSSEGTKQVISEVSERIASNAGPKFESDVSYYGQGHRWMGFAHSTDLESMRDEAENKSLTQAVRR